MPVKGQVNTILLSYSGRGEAMPDSKGKAGVKPVEKYGAIVSLTPYAGSCLWRVEYEGGEGEDTTLLGWQVQMQKRKLESQGAQMDTIDGLEQLVLMYRDEQEVVD